MLKFVGPAVAYEPILQTVLNSLTQKVNILGARINIIIFFVFILILLTSLLLVVTSGSTDHER